MQNKIWEQVGQFLNRLRCENVARDTAVEVPGYKEAQEEVEGIREKCVAVIQQLPQEQRQLLLEWMAKLEDMSSLEGQKAYCQGYVLIDYGKLQADVEADNETLEDVATRLLQKHRKAFEELAVTIHGALHLAARHPTNKIAVAGIQPLAVRRLFNVLDALQFAK